MQFLVCLHISRMSSPQYYEAFSTRLRLSTESRTFNLSEAEFRIKLHVYVHDACVEIEKSYPSSGGAYLPQTNTVRLLSSVRLLS